LLTGFAIFALTMNFAPAATGAPKPSRKSKTAMPPWKPA